MTAGRRICLLLVLPILGGLASKPDLYYFAASPPSRFVLMTVRNLGIDVNIKEVNLMKGEQMLPEFLKINPRHTVPTLDDNGFILTESRAIAAYLSDSHPNGEKLYPRDLKKRARIDEMLHFDAGRLFQGTFDLFIPMIFLGRPYDQEKADRLDEAFKLLDHYVSRFEWVAGDEMSLADLSMVAIVSTADACNYDVNKYPNVAKWYAKCKSAIPDYAEDNAAGAELFGQIFAGATSS